MQYVFLSHDVDWRKEGPSKQHLIERKDRFSISLDDLVDGRNPYYNFPEIMDIEESLGVKSTFFFRTIYENGNYLDYEKEISTLVDGGWEIGLHLDPSSVSDQMKIKDEKVKLEKLTKKKIHGNRVHYLKTDPQLNKKLSNLDFQYDSSFRKSKDVIDKDEMGFSTIDGIYEFPITFMDAYLFTFMKIHEDDLVSVFDKTLQYSRNLGNSNVLTLLWHDNVLQMKGGRRYKEILEFLLSQNDVEILPGMDLATKISKNLLD